MKTVHISSCQRASPRKLHTQHYYRRSFKYVLAGLLAGAGLMLLGLLVVPGVYQDLADRFRWRMGMSSLGQVQMETTLLKVHLRGDVVAGSRATLMFGDSHLHSLPSSALDASVSNYAIAGEPAFRLAERISRYTSVRTAGRVVLLSGSNDLAAGVAPEVVADSVSLAMQQLSPSTLVLLVEIPPSRASFARQEAGRALNRVLVSRCAVLPNCNMVSLSVLADSQGSLREEYASSDGIHMSAAGYERFAAVLRESLRVSGL